MLIKPCKVEQKATFVFVLSRRSSHECSSASIKALESNERERNGGATLRRGPRFGEAHRDHGRAGYEDPALATALWQDTGLDDAIASAVGTVGRRRASGLNPSLRVYRYAVGEVFGAHYDDSAQTSLGGTELTLLLYLTGKGGGGGGGDGGGDDSAVGGGGGYEELVGGETAFYRDTHDGARELFRVAPEVGAVFVFRHGAACLPHASLAVQRGKKVVMRSDVAFR